MRVVLSAPILPPLENLTADQRRGYGCVYCSKSVNRSVAVKIVWYYSTPRKQPRRYIPQAHRSCLVMSCQTCGSASDVRRVGVWEPSEGPARAVFGCPEHYHSLATGTFPQRGIL